MELLMLLDMVMRIFLWVDIGFMRFRSGWVVNRL